MSKMKKPKYFLLTKIFVTMLKIYGVNLDENKNFCDDKFSKKNGGFFRLAILWQCFGHFVNRKSRKKSCENSKTLFAL